MSNYFFHWLWKIKIC